MPWLFAALAAILDFLDGRIQFQEPSLAAMVVAAGGLVLLSRVRRIGRAAEHLPQVVQAALDALPLRRVEDQPARFEEQLARTRCRAAFGGLTRQLKLKRAQVVRIFGVLLAVAGIELQEIRRGIVAEDVPGSAAVNRGKRQGPLGGWRRDCHRPERGDNRWPKERLG